jgi:hypothetical protein
MLAQLRSLDAETDMRLVRILSLAVCVVLLGAMAPRGAAAQADKWDKPLDLKPLVPPVFAPLPPNSRLNPGALSGAPTPYSGSPLQNPAPSTNPSAPGLRLSIPSP